MADKNEKNLTEEELEEIEEEEDEDVEDQDDNKSGKSGSESKSGSKGNNKGNDKGKAGKTFSQEQVTKMMTREKNQGRSAAYKEMGIDPKDTKMVNMFKAFIESQKTEEQKAAEKEAENQTKMNEAEQRAQLAEAKAEAMMLGVKPQFVDDVVTLALSRMTEGSDLKTIIGELKTKYVVWFGESEEEDKDDKKDDKKNKTGMKGTGSSVKNSGKEKKGEEQKSLGARLAAQRKGTAKKSSYWGNK